MANDRSDRGDHHNDKPTKACTFAGCGGTMHFNAALDAVPAPHTLEWPWRATWVCGSDPAHIAVATMAEQLTGGARR